MQIYLMYLPWIITGSSLKSFEFLMVHRLSLLIFWKIVVQVTGAAITNSTKTVPEWPTKIQIARIFNRKSSIFSIIWRIANILQWFWGYELYCKYAITIGQITRSFYGFDGCGRRIAEFSLFPWTGPKKENPAKRRGREGEGGCSSKQCEFKGFTVFI